MNSREIQLAFDEFGWHRFAEANGIISKSETRRMAYLYVKYKERNVIISAANDYLLFYQSLRLRNNQQKAGQFVLHTDSLSILMNEQEKPQCFEIVLKRTTIDLQSQTIGLTVPFKRNMSFPCLDDLMPSSPPVFLKTKLLIEAIESLYKVEDKITIFLRKNELVLSTKYSEAAIPVITQSKNIRVQVSVVALKQATERLNDTLISIQLPDVFEKRDLRFAAALRYRGYVVIKTPTAKFVLAAGLFNNSSKG
jgi:hypothetical protein